jgi:hypothetical protein
MKLFFTLAVIGFLFLSITIFDHSSDVTSCSPSNAVTPLCHFKNPEDIVSVKGTDWLIISEMGDMSGDKPGQLTAYNVKSNERLDLFPNVNMQYNSTVFKGDANCHPIKAQNSFSPHGISLRYRSDEQIELYVINHGGRESVEIFQVILPNANHEKINIKWQGCVLADAQNYFFNDLVSLDNGGFIATNMFNKNDIKVLGINFEMLKALFGMNVSKLVKWTPNAGFIEMEGITGAFFNGIAITDDNQFLFVNSYYDNQTLKINLTSQKIVNNVPVQHPDNSAWDEQGNLLIASHTGKKLDWIKCFMDKSIQNCAAGYSIISMNPASMDTTTLFSHSGGNPGAGVTVAKQHGPHIYMGSFKSQRLLKLAISDIQSNK